jgi:TIR domain-containing protein
MQLPLVEVPDVQGAGTRTSRRPTGTIHGDRQQSSAFIYNPLVMARLFISHSSSDADLTASVADALRGPSAGHPGFEILLDRDCLQAGLPWSNQLDAMMADAHAGLILFTPSALARPDWVRKETLILTWRQSLDPEFRVFHVLLGVQEADLDAKGFGPAELQRIQRLSGADPSAIGAEIRKLLPADLAVGETPLEQLAFFLSLHLKFDGTTLEALAQKLQAPRVTWNPAGPAAGLARIAARILSGQLGTGNNLSVLIKTLRNFGVQNESLQLVLRWVAPFWISQQAAGRLAEVVRDVWDCRRDGWATVNGKYLFNYTAKLFIDKVRPLNLSCRVASDIEPSAASPDADTYTAAICEWLRAQDRELPKRERTGYPADDAGTRALLAKERPFLCVPLEAPDEDTLSTLRDRFPTVVFLLHADTARRPLYARLPVADLEVEESTEEDEYFTWLDAKKALRSY